MAKTWTVGVIGSTGKGDYGHGLDTAWQAVESTKIIAVADDNADGLAIAAKKLNVAKAYRSYDEMLDKERPDIAAVCPRWIDQHFDMAMAAVRRGIHVYMEKPLCRTLQEADALVNACEKHKAKLAVAHPTRYSPKLKTIRQLIKDGRLGQILEWRGRGKEDRRGGGEDLWVLGTHVLDMIHALNGQPKWCHAKLWWKGQPVTKSDVFEGPEGIGPLAGDEVQAMFGMPDGSTAYFSSKRNMAGSPPRYGLQILGSSGIIELLEAPMPSVKFLGSGTWSPGRSGTQWQDVSSVGIGQPEPLHGAEYTARHTIAIRDFITSIEQDRAPIGNVEAARDVTEMIAAVFESHRLGGPVALPLKTRVNPLTLM